MNATIAQASLLIASVLFASLWQGVLVVGAVWIALRSLPRLGAATRYAIWFCTLAALVAIPVFTVSTGNRMALLVLPTAATVAQRAAATPIGEPARVASQSDVGTNDLAVIPDPTARDSDTNVSNERKTSLTIPQNIGFAAALIWLLAAAARGLVLLLDLIKLVAISRNARRWSETHGCQVFLSDSIQVPLAMGFVRPRIVLPASLVDKLSSEELETILIHEIAHLRRYDVWTNAFARMIETCVAINPLAWFVMRQLAMEREIACDDWVVTSIGAGDGFARTLASLANRPRMPVSSAAPSILGSRHAIVIRIERLLDGRPRRLRLSPIALGGAVMFFALIALMLQTLSPVLALEQPAPEATSIPVALSCAVPNRGIIMMHFPGKDTRAKASLANHIELKDQTREIVTKYGAAHVASIDITVDAAGKLTKAVLVKSPNPQVGRMLSRLALVNTYSPARSNCAPIAATVRFSIPVGSPERATISILTPVYEAGWSKKHGTCKIPSVTHARYRLGFQGRLPYTQMLPWFPDSMTHPSGENLNTIVDVHTKPDGAFARVSLAKSSGKTPFDNEALSAARRATYPLTLARCATMPSEYVWKTSFLPNTMLARPVKDREN